ncbi:MAG: ribonuclease E/G [Tyzzerella sp.]|nr:ribonuclease E/G [Tyzzerella sp.]
MNRKLIITKIEDKIITTVLENEKVVELHVSKDEENDSIKLGNIYVGRVKNIVANIKAAFIEVAPGVECYYAIDENPTPIFTKKIGKKPFCIGDELLVQVSKEAVKTKAPTVSSKLNLTGKYAVLTYGDTRVGASAKLAKENKLRLIEFATEYATSEFGIIMRTNAKDAEPELLHAELAKLCREYQHLKEHASTRICYSCMLGAPKEYLTELKNIYQEGLTDIIIEDKTIYIEAKTYIEKEQPEDADKLRLYEDKLLPLHKLYGIESLLVNALKERVWLKSGAYLVIQPTEALTVIDVNTGKCISKKQDDEAYLKINLEAARESARQIRLRNLSGIILVDFINLSKEEYMDELLSVFRQELQKDPIVTSLVDVTKLQLVEVTRKKVRKPLHEIVTAWEE